MSKKRKVYSPDFKAKVVVNDFWRKHLDEFTDDTAWLKWLIENKQSPEQWLSAVKNYKSKPYQVVFEAIEKLEPTDDLGKQENSSFSLLEIQQKCKILWENSSAEILSCIKPNEMYVNNYRESDIDSYLISLKALLSEELLSPLRKLTKADKIYSQIHQKLDFLLYLSIAHNYSQS